MAADSSPDTTGQLRLTYAQLAEQLHISGDAARVLVRRRGWFRIIPNKRGQPTIVVVPTEDLAAEQEKRTAPPDVGGTSADSGSGNLASAFALLDRALSRLIEAERRADEASRRADDAEAKVAELRIELDAARAIAQEGQQAAEVAGLQERLAVALQRADRAEAVIAEERQQVDALRTTIDELKAGQALMTDLHARELVVAQHDALAAQQAAAKAEARAEHGEKAERERADAINALLEATQKELAGQRTLTDAARQDAQAVQEWAAQLRQAEAARKARGRLRRAWDGWRGR